MITRCPGFPALATQLSYLLCAFSNYTRLPYLIQVMAITLRRLRGIETKRRK